MLPFNLSLIETVRSWRENSKNKTKAGDNYSLFIVHFFPETVFSLTMNNVK